MMRVLLLVALLVCSVFAQSSIPFKSLAGDPSEFGSYVLPTPQQNAQTQSSAAQLVQLSASQSKKNIVSADTNIVVDSDTYFAFSFYSPHNEVLNLQLVDPNGKQVNLPQHAQTINFPIGDFAVNGTTYTFLNPITGVYVLTITSDDLDKDLYQQILDSTYSDCYVLVFNENTLLEYTYINTYNSYTGSKIGVVTQAFNDSTFGDADIRAGRMPTAMRDAIETANMVVIFPDGSFIEKPMSDDGLNEDLKSDDGVYGAMITAPQAGEYVIMALLQGTAPNGETFYRTTEQVVSVISQYATMQANFATGTVESGNTRMLVNFLLDSTSAIVQYRAYAEVWGTDANGEAVAVCWIGGMSNSVQTANGVELPLELDLNWISRISAQAPFTLKNVLIQDPNTFIPLIQLDELALKTTFDMAAHMSTVADQLIHDTETEPTEEMIMGRRPLSIMNMTASSASVILAHGYCSEVNPFSAVADQFSDALFFLNAKSSVGNDAFAKLVIQFANNQPFSYIGHSQGGMVGVHIFNYYWTGIDNVQNGRLIQTVGTPYMGCGAAGAAANLGNVFGVGCGTNADLTRDGAALWLPGISQNTRAKLYFWTTTYKLGNWLGDNCNLAMNLVLKWPNDGITELNFAQLEGGNYMGNKEQWCHSVGMKYTAQTQDPDRNAEMNSNAARIISKK